MKTWFWIVLVAFLLLAGYVVVDLVQHPRIPVQPATVAFDVGADSVAAYEQRVAELQVRADSLQKRMKATGNAERREVRARLDEFERQISDLKHAIAQWRVARGGDAPDAAYRQCILLYGKAQGICAALATDTLLGK